MSILHNTSQDMPNSSKINNMSSTIQNHLHAIKIGAFTKQKNSEEHLLHVYSIIHITKQSFKA